jgi:hypothetical protein
VKTEIGSTLLDYARTEANERGHSETFDAGDECWYVRTVEGEPGWRASFRSRIDPTNVHEPLKHACPSILKLRGEELKMQKAWFPSGPRHVDKFWIGRKKVVHAQYDSEFAEAYIVNATEPWWAFLIMFLGKQPQHDAESGD